MAKNLNQTGTNSVKIGPVAAAQSPGASPLAEIDYLWEHWKFNADQRLKAFNFFVIFSVFANGGLFSAIEKCVYPFLLVLIGTFVCLLAFVFLLLDLRSQKLLHLSVPGIKRFEATYLHKGSRLFELDEVNRKGFVRYTVAFRLIFALQIIFGLVAFGFGVLKTWPSLASLVGISAMPTLALCK